MATMITAECINCGACEPECPNTAIYQGGEPWEMNGVTHPPLSNDVFYIVPEKCTECVGFHDQEACAAVCPVDVCIPNPDIPETEAQLLQRAKELHPEVEFGADFPSRFREGNGAAPAEAAAASNAAPAAAAAVAVAAPAAAPAAAKPVAGGRTEKPLARPQLNPTPRVPRQEKTFPSELKMTFEEAVALLSQGRGEAPRGVKWLLALAQPILGALPFKVKKDLELAVGDRRFFSAAGATGFNALHNFLIYPAIFAAVGVFVQGHEVFSQQLNWMIFYGTMLAVIESIWRMREGFRGMPPERTVYRAALYGLPLVPVAAPVVRLLKPPMEVKGTVGQDGFRSDHFDDKIERERRYGQVFRLHTDVNGYLLELEFPRKTPNSVIREELGIGDEMPDYDYDLSLQGKSFVVKGKVTDPNLRRAAAVSSAFPPDFTTTIPLPSRVAGFRHRFVDKNLEVALPKRL
jgi:ferredoxin